MVGYERACGTLEMGDSIWRVSRLGFCRFGAVRHENLVVCAGQKRSRLVIARRAFGVG